MINDVVSLALIGLLLRQPLENLFAVSVHVRYLPKIKFGVKFALLFIALMVTIDLVKHLVCIGRRRLAPSLTSSGRPDIS
jgi:hypothetical protein